MPVLATALELGGLTVLPVLVGMGVRSRRPDWARFERLLAPVGAVVIVVAMVYDGAQRPEFPLEEVSAKVRTGPPVDDEEDYALPIWAGVIPVRAVVEAPVDDPRNLPGMTPPDHVTAFRG